jgi:cytochrome c biogenesis protein CcmG/thiol:disulfide interchange protein DsbE
LPDIGNDFLEHSLVDRIEPTERLVQHDDIRLMEHRGYELQFLLHSLGEVLDFVVTAVFETKPLEPGFDPRRRFAWRDALELGQERQHRANVHAAVKAALLRQIADPVEQVAAHRLAKDTKLAGVGLEDSEQQPNRRRLAGPVGSEKTVGRATWHGQVELVDGYEIAKLFAHSDQLDRRIRALVVDRFWGVTLGLIEHVLSPTFHTAVPVPHRCQYRAKHLGLESDAARGCSWAGTGLAGLALKAEIEPMKRFAFIALLGGIVALFAYALSRQPTLASPLVGHAAPPFEIPYYSAPDSNLVLADFQGRPVVVNFWASWCLSCRAEAAVLEAGWQRHGPEVAFMGVAVNDREAAAKAFIERYGKTYLLAADVDGSVAIDYGLFGVPETFFIAPDGRILSKHIGPVSSAELDRQVTALKLGQVGDASGDPTTVTPFGGDQP